MIEFAYPYMIVLLPLPLIVLWLAPGYKEKKSSVKVPYFYRLVDITGEKPQQGAVVISRNALQKVLVTVSWCCLVVAMAKPEMIGPTVNQEKSARDLMIAVDLSGSMSVQDFTLANGQQVDRLTAVKSVLSDFVKAREHDRLGLTLFGDAPYLQAPFTEDLASWITLLDETEIGMAGQSTAFGDAIGLSISVFEKSVTKNKVLIVLTDGNDTGSKVPPIEAAKVAAAYDIKIYTIAIGDPAAVGEEKVDLHVLNRVSELTGGVSFEALDRAELNHVYQQIDDMEPELFDSLSFRPKTSIHHYPLIAFLLINLLALMLVNVRHKMNQENTLD